MSEWLVAIEFPTQDAYDKYMKEHPDADKSLHTVKKTEIKYKERDIEGEFQNWIKKSGETGSHTLAAIKRWMKRGLSVDDAVAKIYTRAERERRREWGDDLFEEMKKEGKLPWTKYSKGVKASMNMATELLRIARELIGAKFDTKKELEEYKRTHGQRPGTRLQVRNKQEMQERYKSKKAVVKELVAGVKSLMVATAELPIRAYDMREGAKFVMPNGVVFVIGKKIKDEFGIAIEMINLETKQKFVTDIEKAVKFLRREKARYGVSVAARELAAIAKSLVTKTYPVILDKPEWNKKLWLDIQGVAYDIFNMADEDEEGSKSSALAKSKARELAGKYVGYSSVSRSELDKTILEMIWEEYHAGL